MKLQSCGNATMW